MRTRRQIRNPQSRHRVFRSTWLNVLGAVLLFPLWSCTHRSSPKLDPAISSQGRADSLHELLDSRASYRRAGLLVASGDLAFVGSVAFLAGSSTDSTLMLIDASFSDHALTFTREGDSYHAAYDVLLEFEQAGTPTRHVTTHEDVRVGSVDETTRDGESIIYQHATSLQPGEAVVTISIHDAGSTHAGVVRKTVTVPRFDDGTTTALIPALRARPRTSRDKMPDLVLNPRSTSVYGRDSVALFYVESYGSLPGGRSEAVQVHVAGDSVVIYADSVPWIEAGDKLRSALLRVPIAKVGFGELSVGTGGQSRSGSPLLVSFGDGLPVSSFDDMVGLLRFYASSERLRELRELAPMDRTRGWAAFLQATDPFPATPKNATLRQYLTRLADANSRFREDDHTPGWLTDRGMIFSALGEPDNPVEPNGAEADRPQVQVWNYKRYHVRFTFVDRGGFGRWRLTPASEADYRALMQQIAR